jgi:hypothetical protein
MSCLLSKIKPCFKIALGLEGRSLLSDLFCVVHPQVLTNIRVAVPVKLSTDAVKETDY